MSRLIKELKFVGGLCVALAQDLLHFTKIFAVPLGFLLFIVVGLFLMSLFGYFGFLLTCFAPAIGYMWLLDKAKKEEK